jgi:GntR family transcriptional regulator/MocR family aminotransferase
MLHSGAFAENLKHAGKPFREARDAPAETLEAASEGCRRA